MYTVVLKQETEDRIIFDVFKKPLLRQQQIIGNIFCKKDDTGEYRASTSIYMASWPWPKRWDGGRKSYELEEKALWICNRMLEQQEEE